RMATPLALRLRVLWVLAVTRARASLRRLLADGPFRAAARRAGVLHRQPVRPGADGGEPQGHRPWRRGRAEAQRRSDVQHREDLLRAGGAGGQARRTRMDRTRAQHRQVLHLRLPATELSRTPIRSSTRPWAMFGANRQRWSPALSSTRPILKAVNR